MAKAGAHASGLVMTAKKPKSAKRSVKTSASKAQAKAPAVTQLGAAAPIAPSPAEAVLEAVPNPHPSMLYNVRFVCPEFTSICPVTGQPDFAHLVD